ncbi:MAG: hypothetical protein LBO82_02460 [Synergistaceae bacterium]|nr:hypothetical protein [Synergistaceae bacterium]
MFCSAFVFGIVKVTGSFFMSCSISEDNSEAGSVSITGSVFADSPFEFCSPASSLSDSFFRTGSVSNTILELFFCFCPFSGVFFFVTTDSFSRTGFNSNITLLEIKSLRVKSSSGGRAAVGSSERAGSSGPSSAGVSSAVSSSISSGSSGRAGGSVWVPVFLRTRLLFLGGRLTVGSVLSSDPVLFLLSIVSVMFLTPVFFAILKTPSIRAPL